MQTIKYIFADGTTSEIEVTDEFYTLYVELVQQEKRNYWKETRRHISLEDLNENGIDFASPAADLLSVLIQQEDEKRIHLVLRYSRVVFFFSPLPFFPVCTGDVGKTIALEEKSRRCRFMRTDESRGAAARILMFRK